MFKLFQWLKDRWRGNLLGGTRSPKWSQVRKDFLILHDKCEVCGKKKSLLKPLEVHHCVPFSIDKFLELNFDNLITLCKEHHLLVGHLMSFRSFNKDVRADAKFLSEKIKNRP